MRSMRKVIFKAAKGTQALSNATSKLHWEVALGSAALNFKKKRKPKT